MLKAPHLKEKVLNILIVVAKVKLTVKPGLMEITYNKPMYP